ncbi:hypothetical protein NBRC110019_22100 [Neptunitalea chrysea]|uniref:Uncharacterized protein n=1 Tax=Neptunitalea chrysea TaxID=1647581 RepID=A0A9W6B5Y3_9FLAO|nr:hypothetical protein [Neptunitalea chrysea]GLB53170.1 hypothetical protein NBRC110019_22100 [Neptunitalea chrysea]
MKKIVFMLGVFTAFAFTVKPQEQMDRKKGSIECATEAWEKADEICDESPSGCTSYEYYIHTDIAYGMCMFAVDEIAY